jgi:uncharacterized protein
MALEVLDLHFHNSPREALLRVNNANARETSFLSPEKFDQMIASACVATFIPPQAAFLLAFEQKDEYRGGHFHWFRGRFDKFLYIDRVIVAEDCRRNGYGAMLYADLFARAAALGHTTVVCEVNFQPPNPVSDKFHAAHGFEEVGRATIDSGAKTVRYLLRRR